jgi:hypothetical protein
MTLSQVIENNLEEIVSMKMKANEKQFVYMAKDGELKCGHIDQYGQNIRYGFGGKSTRTEAISDLKFIVESEPES